MQEVQDECLSSGAVDFVDKGHGADTQRFNKYSLAATVLLLIKLLSYYRMS